MNRLTQAMSRQLPQAWMDTSACTGAGTRSRARHALPMVTARQTGIDRSIGIGSSGFGFDLALAPRPEGVDV